MDYSRNISDSPGNILNESSANYEKAEMNLLRDALNSSYTERFLLTTRLYKIQQMLKRAKITHKPDPSDK